MLKKIKRFIVKKIFPLFKKSSTGLVFDTPSRWIEQIFDNEQIFIVQVGSNDGISGDPLHYLIQKNKGWNALFIEPVPYLFELLKNSYQNQSRFKFENVAINNGIPQTFYSVKSSAKANIPDLPKWYDQLGSFNKKHITKHLNGVLEPFIEENIIQGLTLPQVLSSNGIENFDLLHIDTEGYDWVVLSQLNLRIYTPAVILYEHKHLRVDEKEASLQHLKHNNYQIFQLGSDFICIKNNRESRAKIKKLKGMRII